jgi:hypothetical protein
MPRKQAAAAEANADTQVPKEQTIGVGSHKIQMVVHPEEKAKLNKFGSYQDIQKT